MGAKNKKTTYKEAKEIFDTHGCVLLWNENEYNVNHKNNRTRIPYVCSCGVQGVTTLGHVRKGGKCGVCGRIRQSKTITKYNITKEILLEKLQTQSQASLAREIGCDDSLIGLYMKKFNIQPVDRYDLTGQRINSFTVLEKVKINNQKHWKCRCELCGKIKIIKITAIKKLKSCGCFLGSSNKHNHNWKGCGDIPGKYWWTIKKGAKTRGHQFDLTFEDIWLLFLKQNKRCALSGVEINFSHNTRREDMTASLDRIDSTKGYCLDNVQWVHKDVNLMKQKFSQEYFIEMCKQIAENHTYL